MYVSITDKKNRLQTTKALPKTNVNINTHMRAPPNEQADYNDSCWAAVRCTFILSSFVLVSPTAEVGGEVIGGPLTSAIETSVTLITIESRGCASGMQGSTKSSANILLIKEAYYKAFETRPEETHLWYFPFFLESQAMLLLTYVTYLCFGAISGLWQITSVFSNAKHDAKNRAARISNRRLY